MGESVSLSVPMPLDSDGFLRRECPTCERQFKWMAATDGDEGTPQPEGGYYCPYCGIQAPADAWWTREQLALAENKTMREVVGPELDKFMRGLGRIGGSPGGLIKITGGRYTPPDEADPLVEVDEDMRRVDFVCHPEEPVKVLTSWTKSVYCLVCGTLANGPS